MRIKQLSISIFAWIYVSIQIKLAQAACNDDLATCQSLPCDGVWDSTSNTCQICATDQPTCESVCQRRWILGSCVKKCTNAANSTDCDACYGKWDGTNCFDCMQDQSICTDICTRYWIQGYCWNCAKDSVSCTDAATCKGEWVTSPATTCNVCWVDSNSCKGCNRYWDASVPPGSCINCQTDSTTCETANKCNGYWNSGTSSCKLCFLNKTNCQDPICGGVWDSINNTCTNCTKDERQYCKSGYNTCTSINNCSGEWDGSVCTICNIDQPTCEDTGAGKCNGIWKTGTPPQNFYCDKCKNSLTECTKCQMNWIPGVPNTCLNCNQDQTTCENTAVCNGVWNTSTSTCNICNQDSGTCEACPKLRRWDPAGTNLCLNCFETSAKCTSCQYFWVPSNTRYDITLYNTCINCNASEEVCTSQQKCNGFWNASTSSCTDQCNKTSGDCAGGQCAGNWDSTNSFCNVCSKTKQECNACSKQWVINQCVNCQVQANCINKTTCGGIWNVAGGTCLVCNENSNNCKACGGFWKNSQCYQCDLSQLDCVSCGGIYNSTDKKCILENDKYTCQNLMANYYKSPYWNGVKCVDCDESQYICNKECFRVWANQSCSNTSCDLDQPTCESLCFHKWNYYQQKCFNIDVNANNVCGVENDSVLLQGKCIQCHASQDLCEVQCNSAYVPNGLRVWSSNKCTDCQLDSNTCTNVCKMDWITITVGATSKSVCLKCNLDQRNCSMCQGQWDPTLLTCTNLSTYCNASSTNCSNICAFIPTKQFFYKSNCYYCNLNQFSCETACNSLWLPRLQFCEILTNQDDCQLNNRGYWDSSNSICKMCNTDSASCLACKSDNSWDPLTNTCLNINLGKEYCDNKGESYVWVTDAMSSANSISLVNGRCISCHLNQNVCENACKRSWDAVGSNCQTCNYSQAVCNTKCGKDWIPPSTCVTCSTSQDICVNTCKWYWDSSTLTCLDCNSSQTTCEDASKCNGNWDGTACQLCNLSIANCEQKCYFVYSQQISACVNCQSSESACQQQCGYIWDATLPSNKCVLCNKSKAICETTGTNKCNGFWLAVNKCTQLKCNQDQTTCEQKCLMKWNSKVSLCQKCTQTQYQDGSGNCQECSALLTKANCDTNCAGNQFFWDTSTNKCRECTATEYWDTNQCKSCTTIHAQCSKCIKVSGTATCLACSNNYRVQSATVCSCDSDRIPDLSNICTLCTVLIPNCASCSVLGTCGTCQQGYSWDPVNKNCRVKYSFTSNTLSGIAFVTDFTVILSYPNAYNPTNAPIVYAVYLYDSMTDYNNELSDFLQQKITKGVLYNTKLAEGTKYSLKLKSGNPVLAPLLILNGQVIPPEDQVLQFSVKKQFTFIDQFTKYINQMIDTLEPKSFYYKMYTDELINQYYKNVCSNCPAGITCTANTNQCNCSTGKALYDCSGLDNTEFDKCVSTLFAFFKDTSSKEPQSMQKVKDLLIHLNTVGNANMNLDIFDFYTKLIPVVVEEKTSPSASDILNYIDIIKKVVTYTDYVMTNSLASKWTQIYQPHDRILTAIQQVLDVRSQYVLETLPNARLSAGSFSNVASLITVLDMLKMQNASGGNEPKIFGTDTDLVIGGNIKVSRFYYNMNPFFVGNSTFEKYKNYPFVEYIVNEKSGSKYIRKDIDFTFIYTVTDIKQSIKCAQREGDFLQLCSSTKIDTSALTITCVCKNSGTLIEKTILVEPNIVDSSSDDYTLYIILGATLGGAFIIFFGSLFVYLKRQKDDDRYKILKKQKDGTRAIDPNLSLSDYDLEIKE